MLLSKIRSLSRTIIIAYLCPERSQQNSNEALGWRGGRGRGRRGGAGRKNRRPAAATLEAKERDVEEKRQEVRHMWTEDGL